MAISDETYTRRTDEYLDTDVAYFYLSIYLSVYLSIHPCIYLSINLSDLYRYVHIYGTPPPPKICAFNLFSALSTYDHLLMSILPFTIVSS